MNHIDKAVADSYRCLCLAVLQEAYNLIIPDSLIVEAGPIQKREDSTSRDFFNSDKSKVFIDYLDLDHDLVLQRVNNKIKGVT